MKWLCLNPLPFLKDTKKLACFVAGAASLAFILHLSNGHWWWAALCWCSMAVCICIASDEKKEADHDE